MEVILLALGLAMDCFAVSVVCGVILGKPQARPMLGLAFFCGLFQALMPLAGWFLTSRFSAYLEAVDHWIAFAMLAFIGGKMIVESFKPGESQSIDPRSVKSQLALAFATSIDAMAVGISFACTGYTSLSSLAWPLSAIGVVSFLMSIAGVLLGTRFGEAVNRRMRPELLGGIILIIIGIKILVEHLW